MVWRAPSQTDRTHVPRLPGHGARRVGSRRLAALLCVLAGSVSGCITMSYVPGIGARQDESPVLERAVATDHAVLVAYRTMTTASRGRVIAFDVPRWSRIELDALSWQRLTEAREGPGPCQQIEVERASPPAALAAHDRDVPILPLTEASVIGATGGARELIALATPYPMSLHPRLMDGRFTIVRHETGRSASLRDAEVCLHPRRYGAWWATPVRVAAAPVTMVADVVTMPVQAALFIWFFVDRPNWHW